MKKFNINFSFDQLGQDKKSDIQLRELIKGDTSLLIAELETGKTLSAHYHNEGSEIYHILSGKGKMEIGRLSGDEIAWNKCLDITPGDIFEIKPKIVHKLSNNGEENLKIIFIAPPSHLSDDRIFIQSRNGNEHEEFKI